MKMRHWGTLAVAAILCIPLAAAGKGRTTEVGPEKAVGGLTVAEEAARQRVLNAQLMSRMPPGVDRSPISVSITDEDRAALAETQPSGMAPLRIGVVKTLPEGVGKPYGRDFNHGVIERSPEGSFVWAVQVESPGAQAIRLHVTGFSLPENTELYFLSSTGQADGPYVGRGPNGDGDFWTRSVATDRGVVVVRYIGTTTELDEPEMAFAISDIGHISGRKPRPQERSHDSWPCSDNAPCLVDASCNTVAAPAEPAKDAVAKMEWIQSIFIYTCSGGLLADTDPGTQIPYFLTANHCFSSSNSSVETFFHYSTSSCNGSCPDSLVTGGTPPPASTVGVTVVATASAGDFTLVTLNQAPPAGTTFLGWNNTPVANSSGTHLYRISNANFGPQVYSQHDVDASSPTCTGWPRGQRIYSVDRVGATMGGSSGSPVVNSASQVVGQLSGCCGFNCGNECDSASNWTVDGALAYYWDSVSAFLDPQGGGCTTNGECDDGLFCTGTETCVAGSCQSSGDPCTGGTTCNEGTNTCDTPACDNDGTCEAGEDCNNCPGDCRQKTNGSPNSRYCCDGDLPGCGNANCNANGWSCAGGGGACSNDGQCSDGLFCNGAEICAGGTCQSGGDPCPGQGCDEGGNVCVSCSGNKASCSSNADCCSNNCKNGTCRGG